jgi:thiamine-monophosphate kinase
VSGGDDYEILCTIPNERLDAFAKAADEAGITVTPIGRIVDGHALPRWSNAEGREIALPRLSYSHF